MVDIDSNVPEAVQKAAEKAKVDGFKAYWISLNGINFVYRPIMRGEWRSLTREQNGELLAAQDDQIALAMIKDKYVEKIVFMCVLYSDVPVDDSIGAGYIDALSDAILIDSGFGLQNETSREV